MKMSISSFHYNRIEKCAFKEIENRRKINNDRLRPAQNTHPHIKPAKEDKHRKTYHANYSLFLRRLYSKNK